MNKRLILFILLCINVIVNAQIKVQNLATPLTGKQDPVARDMISLNPGFQYSGQEFTATIDEKMVLPADYLATPFTSGNRTFDYSAPVSVSHGAASVSATGAANYQIPIDIPTGIAGMEPNISIVYNSQGGSGLLGEGWDISGLSVITRVPRTIFSDGVAGAINFDTNDRYALDGNRLLALSGNYGAQNSTYETEVKTFSKIQSSGQTKDQFENVTGPLYFIVTTKSGQVMEYGNTEDSRIVPHNFNNSNETPIMWRINKITDPNGNYITFKYSDIPYSESVIEKIEYTGNSTKAATSSIQFLYQEKKGNKTVFINDAYLYNRLFLRGINVINNGTVLRKYDFQYFADNEKSFLNIITESNNSDAKLNSTFIEWGANNKVITRKIATISSTSIPAIKDRNWISGDINNDGLSDLISFYTTTVNSEIRTFFTAYANVNNNGSNYFSYILDRSMPGTVNFKVPYMFSRDANIKSENGSISFGDVNGDGTNEIIVPHYFSNSQSIYFYIMGKEFPETIYYSQGLKINSDDIPATAIGDMNNDGISDLIYIEKKAQSNGAYYGKIGYIDNTSTCHWVELPNNLTSIPKYIYVADYNNDGLQDMMVVCENGTTEIQNLGIANKAINPNPSFTCISPTNLLLKSDFSTIQQGDFNGDGSIDFIYNEHCNRNWRMAIKSISGYSITNLTNITAFEEPYTDKNNDKDVCIVTDFNHDGKSDLIIIESDYIRDTDILGHEWGNYSETDITWYVSNGSGFDQYKPQSRIVDENFTFSKYNCQGDYDGDGREDILSYGSDLYGAITKDGNFRVYSSFNTNYEGGFVKTISDEINNNTTFGYKPITSTEKINNISFYTKGTASVYPIINIQAPLYCVSSLTVPNGLGSTTTTNYYYNAVRANLTGRGFLGFSTQTTINPDANKRIITSTELETDNCLLKKQTVEVKTNASTPVLLSKTENNYLNPKIGNSYFSLLASTVINDAVRGNTTTTTYDYSVDGNGTVDPNGNLQMTTTEWGESGSGFINRTKYLNYLATNSNVINIPNKPQQIIIEKEHQDDNGTFIASNTFYTYDQTKGNVISEISNYGSTTGKQVTTNYLNYDQWGHPLTVTTTANSEGGAINISKSYIYDPTGLYVTSITDGLGKTSSTYDGIYGTLIKSTAVNGLETKYKYDAWGRLYETQFPDGNKSTSSVTWANGTGPANALYYTKTENTGRPWTKTWYDNLGRKLREESVGYSGIIDYTDFKYNPKGQVEKQTSFSNNVKMDSVTFAYNTDNDRIIKETYSNGKIVEYSYLGNSVTTKVNGIEKTTDYDQWGNVKKVIEPTPGGTIDYTYWSNGKPHTIATNGVSTSMTYDELGNQETLNDPDAGITEYHYDALGRLTYQKDAMANVIKSFYDNLGRLDYKSNGSGVLLTDYDYYSDGKGIGQVKKITAKNGSWDSFEYDDLGRQYKTTRHIDATYKDLVFQNHYDAYGNVDKITYPDNYIVDQQFDQYGNLIKVLNGSTEIWALNNLSTTSLKYTLGNGQVTEKTFDNNGLLTGIKTSKGAIEAQNLKYEYNVAKGLLTSREDIRTNYNLKEAFTYDDLNRLKTWEVTKNNIVSSSHELNYKKDKINGKSDIGNYFYNNSLHPHAVSSVITSGTAPTDLKLTYNEFGKTSSISWSYTYEKLALEYGPDDERTKTVYTVMGALKSTNYYNGLYEAKQNVNEYLKEYYYIMGGDGIAAVNVRCYGTNTLYYVHKDHLGSITCLTNASGAISEQMNYDPWGRRRNPSDWSFTSVTTPSILSRGFTGHEHLDNSNLINMNGRIYDPTLGLFISCDNYIQNPVSTQGLNRYSYCFGNPLSYTDPDGNNPLLAMLIYGAITQGAMMGTQTYAAGGDFWKGAVTGAGISIVTSLITQGVTSLPIVNKLSGFGQSLVAGGTAFTTTGLSSMALNGKWDWNSSLMAGGMAFAMTTIQKLTETEFFTAESGHGGTPIADENRVKAFAKGLGFEEGKHNLTDLTTDGRSLSDTYIDNEGHFYTLKSDGSKVLSDGFTHRNFFSNNNLSIHISPYASSSTDFYLIRALRHEAVHLTHFNLNLDRQMGWEDFDIRTEHAAYMDSKNYSISINKSIIDINNMLKIYNISDPRFVIPSFPLK